ncbi:hypothetical protein MKX03_003754, partial [Papaver bracteatum]
FVDSPSASAPLWKNIESESPNGYRIGDCSENPLEDEPPRVAPTVVLGITFSMGDQV